MNKKLMIIAGAIELFAGILMMIATGKFVIGCSLLAAGFCFITVGMTLSE